MVVVLGSRFGCCCCELNCLTVVEIFCLGYLCFLLICYFGALGFMNFLKLNFLGFNFVWLFPKKIFEFMGLLEIGWLLGLWVWFARGFGVGCVRICWVWSWVGRPIVYVLIWGKHDCSFWKKIWKANPKKIIINYFVLNRMKIF